MPVSLPKAVRHSQAGADHEEQQVDKATEELEQAATKLTAGKPRIDVGPSTPDEDAIRFVLRRPSLGRPERHAATTTWATFGFNPTFKCVNRRMEWAAARLQKKSTMATTTPQPTKCRSPSMRQEHPISARASRQPLSHGDHAGRSELFLTGYVEGMLRSRASHHDFRVRATRGSAVL